MQETPQNNQSGFMIEKIKERPVNKKMLLRRTIITASMAVIFGLIACFTFLVLEPVISNWLYPEEEPQLVVFPEDQEEMSPEEMLQENMEQEKEQQKKEQQSLLEQMPELLERERIPLEPEQIQEILSEVTMDLESYKEIYSSLSDYVKELNQYMVTVTGISSNIDWFNNVQESEHQASGVIIASNGKELLILVDYAPLANAETLSLTFYNGMQVDATVKEHDTDTDLAVLAVELTKLDEDFLKNGLKIAVLGSSNVSNIVGMPVVALGRPMGTAGSLGYGVITSAATALSETDTNYKLLQTDITGSKNAGGMLFNLKGQLIGVITNKKGSSDMKNMVTAYGITELKKRIEKMSNGEKMAYLGISGVDVTLSVHEELGVPFGAYITEIEMDSPAMQAGMQQGDIMVQMNEKLILSYGNYTTTLMQFKVGDPVKVVVMRQVQNEYKEMEFDITLGEAK